MAIFTREAHEGIGNIMFVAGLLMAVTSPLSAALFQYSLECESANWYVSGGIGVAQLIAGVVLANAGLNKSLRM